MSVWDDNAELVFGSDDRPGKLGFVDSCRVSYSLGLLGPIGLADAQRVAKIRNSFAHHFEITSFSEPSINDRCKALESPERFMKVIGSGDSNIATPRPRYIWTVLALDAMLYYAASVYSPKWPKRPIGTEPYW
jgi:hypothetical protein